MSDGGIKALFDAEGLARIRQVTAAAEAKSGGEIVPYLVARIDDYPEARWRAATLGALLFSLLAGAIYPFSGAWDANPLPWIGLPPALGIAYGLLLAQWPALRRRLVCNAEIERRLHLRAEAAFLQEEIFATADRSGILLFLAVFEQRALVLADSGIHRRIPEETWQQLIDVMVAGIKAGRPAEAVCAAIERCGDILAEHRIERHADDSNELADGLRVRES